MKKETVDALNRHREKYAENNRQWGVDLDFEENWRKFLLMLRKTGLAQTDLQAFVLRDMFYFGALHAVAKIKQPLIENKLSFGEDRKAVLPVETVQEMIRQISKLDVTLLNFRQNCSLTPHKRTH